MNVRLSPQFERSYASAPLQIQKLFDRKLALLVQNLRHPSLRAKKYDEARDIWQARIEEHGVFTFRSGVIPIISLTSHPIPNEIFRSSGELLASVTIAATGPDR